MTVTVFFLINGERVDSQIPATVSPAGERLRVAKRLLLIPGTVPRAALQPFQHLPLLGLELLVGDDALLLEIA